VITGAGASKIPFIYTDIQGVRGPRAGSTPHKGRPEGHPWRNGARAGAWPPQAAPSPGGLISVGKQVEGIATLPLHPRTAWGCAGGASGDPSQHGSHVGWRVRGLRGEPGTSDILEKQIPKDSRP
jgi:hypothetical protein